MRGRRVSVSRARSGKSRGDPEAGTKTKTSRRCCFFGGRETDSSRGGKFSRTRGRRRRGRARRLREGGMETRDPGARGEWGRTHRAQDLAPRAHRAGGDHDHLAPRATQVRARLGERAEHGQVQVALAQQRARANLNHDHLVLAFRLSSNPRGPRGRSIHVGVHLTIRRDARKVVAMTTESAGEPPVAGDGDGGGSASHDSSSAPYKTAGRRPPKRSV